MKFKNVAKLINLEFERVQSELKIYDESEKTRLIDYKNELLDARALLEFGVKFELGREDLRNAFELPALKLGYGEYRLINDCESGDRALWLEPKISGETQRLNEGDVVIKKR